MFQNFKYTLSFRVIAVTVMTAFLGMIPLQSGYAQVVMQMPAAGQMIHVTSKFEPAQMAGLRVDLKDPFHFYFVMNKGQRTMNEDVKRAEYEKLIKYFLASLTIPNDDMWVNLSPLESTRIIPDNFAQTEMGRDLLAQDYILKQLSSSLMYPEDDIGKEFWKKVYAEAYKKYGTTDIPIDTFNKVWIVADTADIFQKGDTAFVVKSHLKVMLEQDFMAITQNKEQFGNIEAQDPNATSETRKLASDIIREVVVPIIEKEVNEGESFALVRQVYSSMIMATWFKRTLKESLLNQVYTDKNKVSGIEVNDPKAKEKIYQQYLEAYKVGVFNYIKEDVDPVTQEVLPRKYFSGGAPLGPTTEKAIKVNSEKAMAEAKELATSLTGASKDTFPLEAADADVAQPAMKQGDNNQKRFFRTVNAALALTAAVMVFVPNAQGSNGDRIRQQNQSIAQAAFNKGYEQLKDNSAESFTSDGFKFEKIGNKWHGSLIEAQAPAAPKNNVQAAPQTTLQAQAQAPATVQVTKDLQDPLDAFYPAYTAWKVDMANNPGRANAPGKFTSQDGKYVFYQAKGGFFAVQIPNSIGFWQIHAEDGKAILVSLGARDSQVLTADRIEGTGKFTIDPTLKAHVAWNPLELSSQADSIQKTGEQLTTSVTETQELIRQITIKQQEFFKAQKESRTEDAKKLQQQLKELRAQLVEKTKQTQQSRGAHAQTLAGAQTTLEKLTQENEALRGQLPSDENNFSVTNLAAQKKLADDAKTLRDAKAKAKAAQDALNSAPTKEEESGILTNFPWAKALLGAGLLGTFLWVSRRNNKNKAENAKPGAEDDKKNPEETPADPEKLAKDAADAVAKTSQGDKELENLQNLSERIEKGEIHKDDLSKLYSDFLKKDPKNVQDQDKKDALALLSKLRDWLVSSGTDAINQEQTPEKKKVIQDLFTAQIQRVNALIAQLTPATETGAPNEKKEAPKEQPKQDAAAQKALADKQAELERQKAAKVAEAQPVEAELAKITALENEVANPALSAVEQQAQQELERARTILQRTLAEEEIKLAKLNHDFGLDEANVTRTGRTTSSESLSPVASRLIIIQNDIIHKLKTYLGTNQLDGYLTLLADVKRISDEINQLDAQIDGLVREIASIKDKDKDASTTKQQQDLDALRLKRPEVFNRLEVARDKLNFVNVRIAANNEDLQNLHLDEKIKALLDAEKEKRRILLDEEKTVTAALASVAEGPARDKYTTRLGEIAEAKKQSTDIINKIELLLADPVKMFRALEAEARRISEERRTLFNEIKQAEADIAAAEKLRAEQQAQIDQGNPPQVVIDYVARIQGLRGDIARNQEKMKTITDATAPDKITREDLRKATGPSTNTRNFISFLILANETRVVSSLLGIDEARQSAAKAEATAREQKKVDLAAKRETQAQLKTKAAQLAEDVKQLEAQIADVQRQIGGNAPASAPAPKSEKPTEENPVVMPKGPRSGMTITMPTLQQVRPMIRMLTPAYVQLLYKDVTDPQVQNLNADSVKKFQQDFDEAPGAKGKITPEDWTFLGQLKGTQFADLVDALVSQLTAELGKMADDDPRKAEFNQEKQDAEQLKNTIDGLLPKTSSEPQVENGTDKGTNPPQAEVKPGAADKETKATTTEKEPLLGADSLDKVFLVIQMLSGVEGALAAFAETGKINEDFIKNVIANLQRLRENADPAVQAKWDDAIKRTPAAFQHVAQFSPLEIRKALRKILQGIKKADNPTLFNRMSTALTTMNTVLKLQTLSPAELGSIEEAGRVTTEEMAKALAVSIGQRDGAKVQGLLDAAIAGVDKNLPAETQEKIKEALKEIIELFQLSPEKIMQGLQDVIDDLTDSKDTAVEAQKTATPEDSLNLDAQIKKTIADIASLTAVLGWMKAEVEVIKNKPAEKPAPKAEAPAPKPEEPAKVVAEQKTGLWAVMGRGWAKLFPKKNPAPEVSVKQTTNDTLTRIIKRVNNAQVKALLASEAPLDAKDFTGFSGVDAADVEKIISSPELKDLKGRIAAVQEAFSRMNASEQRDLRATLEAAGLGNILPAAAPSGLLRIPQFKGLNGTQLQTGFNGLTVDVLKAHIAAHGDKLDVPALWTEVHGTRASGAISDVKQKVMTKDDLQKALGVIIADLDAQIGKAADAQKPALTANQQNWKDVLAFVAGATEAPVSAAPPTTGTSPAPAPAPAKPLVKFSSVSSLRAMSEVSGRDVSTYIQDEQKVVEAGLLQAEDKSPYQTRLMGRATALRQAAAGIQRGQMTWQEVLRSLESAAVGDGDYGIGYKEAVSVLKTATFVEAATPFAKLDANKEIRDREADLAKTTILTEKAYLKGKIGGFQILKASNAPKTKDEWKTFLQQQLQNPPAAPSNDPEMTSFDSLLNWEKGYIEVIQILLRTLDPLTVAWGKRVPQQQVARVIGHIAALIAPDVFLKPGALPEEVFSVLQGKESGNTQDPLVLEAIAKAKQLSLEDRIAALKEYANLNPAKALSADLIPLMVKIRLLENPPAPAAKPAPEERSSSDAASQSGMPAAIEELRRQEALQAAPAATPKAPAETMVEFMRLIAAARQAADVKFAGQRYFPRAIGHMTALELASKVKSLAELEDLINKKTEILPAASLDELKQEGKDGFNEGIEEVKAVLAAAVAAPDAATQERIRADFMKRIAAPLQTAKAESDRNRYSPTVIGHVTALELASKVKSLAELEDLITQGTKTLPPVFADYLADGQFTPGFNQGIEEVRAVLAAAREAIAAAAPAAAATTSAETITDPVVPTVQLNTEGTSAEDLKKLEDALSVISNDQLPLFKDDKRVSQTVVNQIKAGKTADQQAGVDFFANLSNRKDSMTALMNSYLGQAGEENGKKAQAIEAKLKAMDALGGINMSEDNLTITIKVGDDGMPLPAKFQDPAMINIQGLSPIIREIAPANAVSIPLLSDLMQMAGSSAA